MSSLVNLTRVGCISRVDRPIWSKNLGTASYRLNAASLSVFFLGDCDLSLYSSLELML